MPRRRNGLLFIHFLFINSASHVLDTTDTTQNTAHLYAFCSAKQIKKKLEHWRRRLSILFWP
jgi:hypothetical protein